MSLETNSLTDSLHFIKESRDGNRKAEVGRLDLLKKPPHGVSILENSLNKN
jgi:hypothetical protein